MSKDDLEKLEDILYREEMCIASVDVPLLMKVIYEEFGVALPRRLKKDVADSLAELEGY